MSSVVRVFRASYQCFSSKNATILLIPTYENRSCKALRAFCFSARAEEPMNKLG